MLKLNGVQKILIIKKFSWHLRTEYLLPNDGTITRGKMPEEKKRSSNDQRSDAFNPTSSDSRANANNRSNQMNPNNPAYRSSRKGRK